MPIRYGRRVTVVALPPPTVFTTPKGLEGISKGCIARPLAVASQRFNLVTDQTRIVNQIKAILARFGIRTFRPTLRKAAEKLDGLRTAEGTLLLENTRAELRRHLARLRVVREQIGAIEHE